MIKRVFISIMILGLLPMVAGAFAIPEPDIVVDQANVITEPDTLKSQLVTYQQQTGHEIAVLTLLTLDGEPIEMVANEVFRTWGIGDRERNDGVLMVVAVNDRAARIEVGYGLEGALPDITANRILNEIMFPLFKAGDYNSGIRAGIAGIMQSIAGEPVFPKKSSDGFAINPVYAVTIGIFFVNFLWMIFGQSKSWWQGGIAGGVVGGIIGLIVGTLITAGIALVVGTIAGLLFDFIASKFYKPPTRGGGSGPMFFGGGFGGGSGFGGGGFGGFGGGSSGGGGASGRW